MHRSYLRIQRTTITRIAATLGVPPGRLLDPDFAMKSKSVPGQGRGYS